MDQIVIEAKALGLIDDKPQAAADATGLSADADRAITPSGSGVPKAKNREKPSVMRFPSGPRSMRSFIPTRI